MIPRELPFVSVVTPVYNGGGFIAECIESVLSQTYQNYEYLIVNNCSKDNTLDISSQYAKRDSRIRICDNETFLDVIANHNHAFGLISPTAKYCKIVSGDDFIFPDCLRQMVETAEANPSAGIIGSYQQSGKRILWQGFKYPDSVLSGHRLCRDIFLSDHRGFGFGSPTSLLYRADIVRGTKTFYPNPSPHSDTSACFMALKNCDFGFVYQVLSYERIHEQTQSSESARLNRYLSACLNDLLQYGPDYLSDAEFNRLLKTSLAMYHRFLVVNYISRSQGDRFWAYHESRLQELGYPLKSTQLAKAFMKLIWEELLNPRLALSKLSKRFDDYKGGQESRLSSCENP